MKTLTLLLLLVTGMAYGQSGTLSLDSLKGFDYNPTILPLDFTIKPSNEYAEWSIMKVWTYAISDSSGTVAYKDYHTGEWTIKDCEKALEVMIKSYEVHTERIMELERLLYKKY